MAHSQYRSSNPIVPPVILNLMIANAMMFFFQTFFGQNTNSLIIRYLALWPLDSGYFLPWQVLTYGFLHGGLTHIIFNMFALWMFGREIELNWGSRRFTAYYFVCVIGAAILQLLVSFVSVRTGGMGHVILGASGGTYGILLAFAMMFPYRKILLIFFPVPIEARFFVLIYGGAELIFGVTGMNTGIAHFAHLGGMLFGFLLILYWRGKLPLKPKKRMYW